MADLVTLSLDISKLKIRWEEPYVSEAVNKANAAFPRGIYRGFSVNPTATPSTSFRVLIDPDSIGVADGFLVYRDLVNGFSLAVRETDEPVFDMSSRFPIPGGGEIWWIYVDVDYSTGSATDGNYHVVLDGTPIPDDAIVLAKIVMNNGDTVIGTSNIDTSLATIPSPTKREAGAYVAGDQVWGFLSGEDAWNVPTENQKKAMNNAPTAPSASNPFVTKADSADRVFAEPTIVLVSGLSSATKFQLTGSFYVGKESISSFDPSVYFFLAEPTGRIDTPLVNSDKTLLFSIEVLKDDGTTSLDPGTDPGVDANGFYTNPYIRIGTVSYTGSLRVVAFKRATYLTLDAIAKQFSLAGTRTQGHGSRTYSAASAGSPDSLTGDSISSQLSQLLSMVNARIKTIHPTSSSASPVLLWRSNNKTLGSEVTKDTISFYWMNNVFIVTVGGYLNSATSFKLGNDVASADVVTIEVIGSLFNTRAKKKVGALSPGFYFTWQDHENWDAYEETGAERRSSGALQNNQIIWTCWTQSADRRNGMIFQGSVGSHTGLGKSSNCRMIDVSGVKKWERSSTLQNSTCAVVTEDGTALYFKSKDESSPWSDSVGSGGWTSVIYFSTGGSSPIKSDCVPVVDGSYYFSAPYGASVIATGAGETIKSIVQFPVYATGVSSGDVTISKVAGENMSTMTLDTVLTRYARLTATSDASGAAWQNGLVYVEK